MKMTKESLIAQVRDHASVESIMKIINANYKIYLHPSRTQGTRIKDIDTLKVLHEIMVIAVETDYFALVKHMYQCGYKKIEDCTVNQRCCKEFMNTTIFHLVCEKGNIDMIKLIIAYKPDVCCSLLIDCTKTPFSSALKHDNVEILQLLLPLYYKQRLANGRDSPLIVATEETAIECFKYLIKHYPREVNARNQFGYTPLLLAISKGLEYVKPLVDNGAGVATRIVPSHRSCLHILFTHFHLDVCAFMPPDAPDIARFLIEKGADVNHMDNDFDTPLTLVCKGYSTELSDISRNAMKYSFEEHHRLITESVKILLHAGTDPCLGGNRTAVHVLTEAITLSWDKLLKLSSPQGNLCTNRSKEEIELTCNNAYETLLMILQKGGTPDSGWKSAMDHVITFLNRQYGITDSQWQSIWPRVMKCAKTLLLYGSRTLSVKELVLRKYYSKSLLCMIFHCLNSSQRDWFITNLRNRCSERINVNEFNYLQDVLFEIMQAKSLSDICRRTILSNFQRPVDHITKLGLPPILTEYILSIDS